MSLDLKHLSRKQQMGILIGEIAVLVIAVIGILIVVLGRNSDVSDIDASSDKSASKVDIDDIEPANSEVNFVQIYNEHCVTEVEREVCRLAKGEKTLTLLTSFQDIISGADTGKTFSQLYYEITDALGIDQKQVMTDEVLDKIMLGEYSVEMQFGAVRIVQFVVGGIYFASFVVVDGYNSIYENSAGPISTEYSLVSDTEDVSGETSSESANVAENTSASASTGQSTGQVAQSSSASSTVSSVATSVTSSSSVTKPTTTTTTSSTTTSSKQPDTTKTEESTTPKVIDTSMSETTSEWGTDASLKADLARAHLYVYSGREFKLSSDGTELTLEVTAEEVASKNQPWKQKLSDMDASVFMLHRNEKWYDYFTEDILVPNVNKAPLVICNLEQGVRYNADSKSWTLYLKLRPKAKC